MFVRSSQTPPSLTVDYIPQSVAHMMADGWLEFALYIGIPLFIILQPELPEFADMVIQDIHRWVA